MKTYDGRMKEQLLSGILERVLNPRLCDGPRMHYLPHQPVEKENSSFTKMRIVFDASSGQPCLNSMLERGKVYAGQKDKQICNILTRVRLSNHLLTMDLEKAFLQIEVRKSDRDVTRILWPADPWHDEEPEVLRFARVTFGLNCAPFLLGATLEYHLERNPRPWSENLMKGSYVDNFILSLDNPGTIDGLVRDIRELFWAGGFNCRQYASDCRAEVEALPEEWQEPKKTLSLLGIQWDTETDELSLEMPIWSLSSRPTKRRILATIGSVFDPGGWFSPAVLPAKLIQANVWKEKGSWDEPLPSVLEEEWLEIMRTWEDRKFVLPRRAFADQVTSLTKFELHGFADACERGLGIAIYVRRTDTGQTSLVFGKSLVIPTSLQPKPKKDKEGNLKPREISIPRLELHAAFLMVKAVKKLQLYLKIPVADLQMWTDATTVIQWLVQGQPKDVFIGNRLNVIREFPFKHVDTRENPADIASRGKKPDELLSEDTWSLWTRGPEWLSKPREDWPEPIVKFEPGDEKEVASNPFYSIDCAAVVKEVPPPLIDANRFDRLYKLKRATVVTLRFLYAHLMKKANKESSLGDRVSVLNENGRITVEELSLAEEVLVRENQRAFPPEVATERNLRIFADQESVLRCGGRLRLNEELADGVKFPIFLSKQSPLVKLIVIDVHIKNQHCGAQILLSEFRMRFWTPQIRNLIRNTLYFDRRRKCLPCFAFQAKPYDPPPEPPLPIERMQAGAAFQNVGIDFFGPFYCRTGSEAKKAYGCIFACFVTRAVHLEVITDMTADRFLLALRRFISRRGTPRFILSDNAPQYKLAAELIQKQWWRVTADDQVKEFLVVKGIKWNFITTYAPWRGALYERLIALVKHGLRRVVGKKMIELEELDTLFAEAERVVNLRPLTTMTDGEISRPLRPIDFLQPKTDPAFISEPDSKTDDPDYHLSRSRDSEIDKLTKLYQKTMVKVDCFWVQWRNDYLLALRERWQTGKAKGRQSQPEIGQTVIIHDENLPRNLWKMGVVVRLESSRTALVKTSAGKELRRAVNHLFPLEIEPEVKVPDESAEEFVDEEEREEQVVPANEEAEPEAEPNKRVRKKKRDKIYIYDSDEEYEEITASAVQKLKARKQSVTHTLWTLLILFILSLNRSVQGQKETILKG
jgi:hypothetical protein